MIARHGKCFHVFLDDTASASLKKVKNGLPKCRLSAVRAGFVANLVQHFCYESRRTSAMRQVKSPSPACCRRACLFGDLDVSVGKWDRWLASGHDCDLEVERTLP